MENSSQHLIIGGQPVRSTRSFGVINPATGSVFAQCPLATEDELNAAVEAARRAFPAWADRPIDERARLIELIADALEAQTEGFIKLLSAEQGKPERPAASGEITAAVSWIRATARLRSAVEVIQDDDVARVEVHHKPLGVVGSITPWNHPVLIATWHIMPALLAGNTVVIKPSAYTPLTTLWLVALANQVLPPGVLNSVAGEDSLGRAMSEHAGIDKIIFTGSTATGRKVMASSSATLKRLTLELGGNDAAIVLEDADVEKCAARIFAKTFNNSGQTCAAIKRLYVHESIHDALAERLAALARDARVGAGNEPGTQFGPLQNRKQFEHVCALAEDARRRGGRFLAGGQPLDGPGYFFPLTIVVDVKEGARVVDEEQFGPILPVMPFRDEEEALRRANASENGLGGSIWSSDVARATALAQRLECGTAWVNDHASISPIAPFGGAKQSGIGVEFGLRGLEEFMQLQTVRIAR
jgi:acyl-CoA reductase-like NAD-dependent aldehyde dehydrogenase